MTEPNQEHLDVWNQIIAPKYIRLRHIVADGFGAHSDGALERVRPKNGQRVLDVGCGMGESTVAIAALVGTNGRVVGIDGCEAFIDIARREASDARLSQIEYVAGDAQLQRFEAPFDIVFSRFGVMFFASPVAALKQLRADLKPGGLFAAVVWRKLEDNPWVGLSKDAALEVLPPIEESGPTCGPGPFSMASADVTSDVLKAAGFRNIEFVRQDYDVFLGHNEAELCDFVLSLGPGGELFRLAGDEGPKRRAKLDTTLARNYAPYKRADGYYVPSSSWLVRGSS